MKETLNFEASETEIDRLTEEVEALIGLPFVPEELRERWEDMLADCENAKQLEKLKAVILKRKEMSDKPFAGVKSSGKFRSFLEAGEMDLSEKEIEKITKDALLRIEKVLGEGASAKVAKGDFGFCYKFITNPEEYRSCNNLEEEMILLLKAHELNLPEVFIPRPAYAVMTDDVQIMVMETLDAVALDDVIVERKEKMPDDFQLDSFFEKLNKAVETMNQQGIYHQDLHGGNIMIDRKTGNPCIIDFGKSVEVADFDKDDRTKLANQNVDREALQKRRLETKRYLDKLKS